MGLTIRRRVKWVPPGGFNVVHAADVADAHLWAMDHGTPGARYPVPGHNVSLVDYVARINSAAGHPWMPSPLPTWLLHRLAKGRVFDTYVSQLLTRSNFVAPDLRSPVPVRPLEAIVHDSVAWFAQHRRLIGLLSMWRYVWQRYV